MLVLGTPAPDSDRSKGPPFNIQGEGRGLEFLQREIMYFNPARRRAKNFKFYYMLI